MDKTIEIKYKNLEFTVELTDASSSSKNDWTIMSMYTGSSVILEDYSADVFFDKFVGEEFKKEDLDRWTRKIKRSVGLYMRGKENEEEVVVEVVSNTPKESEKPAGAIDRIIFDTVERALSSDQSKAGIDTLIKDLIKENGVIPFRKVLEVRKADGKTKEVGLQHKDFEKILKTISAGVNVALVGPAGSGKLQPLTEPILTPKGWVSMGDIKVGSKVLCPISGSPIKVLKTFPQENLDIYKVSFGDGTYTECCNDHLWEIQTKKDILHKKSRVVDTNYMINNGVLYKPSSNGSRSSKYKVRLTNPVEFEYNKPILDPYLLGLLLGDGYLSSKGGVTLTSHSDIAEEVFNTILPLIPSDVKIRLDKQYGDVKARRITFTSKIKPYLKELGLLGKKSRVKFIPKNYIYNSIEVRKKVLAGLVDTDGYSQVLVSKKKASYSTMSIELRDNVVELIRSLGGTARFTADRRDKYKDDGVCWGISFRTPFNPFTRKEKYDNFEKYKYFQGLRKSIRSIEFVRKDKGQCILVDSDRHLYITRDYTVTHNTTIVSNVAKILDMGFASQSVSAQSTTFDFFGYKNAKGDYVSTLFREKYENGGVFLLDEFDAGNPNVLAALNQATANDEAPFPDKMVERHKDFIIIMAGNTFNGGTIDYVGRNKIDAATLDRFAYLYIGYDEDLERAISTNESWCNKVQEYRENALRKKVRVIISPRATFYGEQLIASGISQSEVEDMVIFKALNDDERNLIQIR